MKKFTVTISCFLIACTFIIFFSSSIKNSDVSSKQKDTSDFSLAYIVKEFKGNIAIFEKGKQDPFKIIEVPVSSLPIEDQNLLASGIEAHDEKELSSILEDYCS